MGFKEAINEYGKQISAAIYCDGATYRDEQIVSMNSHYDGGLLKSVMRCMDIQLDGVRAVDGTNIASARFSVKAPDDTDYSVIEFGAYIIKEQKYDDDSNTLNLECYDTMIQSMIPYDLSLDYSSGITVKDFLDAICNRLGWTPGYSTFTNSDVLIEKEKFDSDYTFRDVLDQIAQVAAGVIAFVGSRLCVLYPRNSGHTIDASNLKSLTIGEKYGPINSVVLARTPQEDNIYAQDVDSISENGLTEIKIENNQIMDSHREDFISGILSRLNGLSFWLYELESFGIGYLYLCDQFTLETLDGTKYETIMLNDDLQITQGVSEKCSATAPEGTETDYSAASETDRVLNQTILKVDKQAGEITALASRTGNVESSVNGLSTQVTNMNKIIMDAEKVKLEISTAIAGIDSITTSTGYTFDQDGLHIQKSGEEIENLIDNTGMYVNRGEDNILAANNEGVDAINLRSRQFLIIGDNSRFENYGANRTACFYIGGS